MWIKSFFRPILVMLLSLPIAACHIEHPVTFPAQPLHEVANDQGWRLEIVQLPGWETGAEFLVPAGDGKTAYGQNERFQWWIDLNDLKRENIGDNKAPPVGNWQYQHDDMKMFDMVTAAVVRKADLPEAAVVYAGTYEINPAPPAISPDGKWQFWDVGTERHDRNGDAHLFEIRGAATGNTLVRLRIYDWGQCNARWLPDNSGIDIAFPVVWRIARILLPADFPKREPQPPTIELFAPPTQ